MVLSEELDRLGLALDPEKVSSLERLVDELLRWNRRRNLTAIIDRDEVLEKLEQIARLLGNSCRRHEVLFSTRILKKTGLRLVA